ncbi:hypothetical protein ACQJBY_007697 [Aegilops geniculata]
MPPLCHRNPPPTTTTASPPPPLFPSPPVPISASMLPTLSIPRRLSCLLLCRSSPPPSNAVCPSLCLSSSVWFLLPISLTVVDTALISHPLLSPLAHHRHNVVSASLARVERSHTLPAHPLVVAYPGRSRSPGLHRVLPSAAPHRETSWPSVSSIQVHRRLFVYFLGHALV